MALRGRVWELTSCRLVDTKLDARWLKSSAEQVGEFAHDFGEFGLEVVAEKQSDLHGSEFSTPSRTVLN